MHLQEKETLGNEISQLNFSKEELTALVAKLRLEIIDLESRLKAATENNSSSQGELKVEIERLMREIADRIKQHAQELQELKDKLNSQKKLELQQMREKYERELDALKRASLNDKQGVAKELQKRIDELE